MFFAQIPPEYEGLVECHCHRKVGKETGEKHEQYAPQPTGLPDLAPHFAEHTEQDVRVAFQDHWSSTQHNRWHERDRDVQVVLKLVAALQVEDQVDEPARTHQVKDPDQPIDAE